ncbi:MAG TPA: GMC family oxidoreductase [Bryobacteraceae bacterium]|jgi:choline dehydrogenase-like flavoprotein|nr:GMC family oxidoreductase [Bryobacteraceae bacterium]
MPKKVYDVIVVGTGAGGSTAMKTLCEAGLNVLALNSGRRTNPAKDYGNHRQRYELKYRAFGDPKTRSQRQGDCEQEVTWDLFEHDITYTVAPGTKWKWTRCKGTGGKANFWGRSSARFSEIDFRAASLDGHDVDWPITYEEIAPYYTRVERMIGVASTVQNRPSNPDGDYLPPFKLRCLDYILKAACDEMGIPYLPDRCAQLTVPHNHHPACHYCGSCTTGCDVGAFFSPTWYFIPDAEKTGKLELRTNAHVKNVIVREDGKAAGLAYIDRATRQEVEVYAKVVVLAASCCETAKIMLNSKSRHWPTGIANSSGQLGRNLVDHLYATPVYGYLPKLVGQAPHPDSVADSTVVWMPRWQNLRNPFEEKFIRGYSVYPGGGCGGYPYYWNQIEGFGTEFKRSIRKYYPSPVGFLLQAPSLVSEKNFIDIDPEVKDIFGIPVARFHYQWGPNELMMLEHSIEVCSEIMRRAGGEIWGTAVEPDPPGHSLHETGPCRFGNDPKKFVLDRFSACHDVPNLYVADASMFPTPTDKTTTLSILAFTLRSCEHMLEKFRRGEFA